MAGSRLALPRSSLIPWRHWPDLSNLFLSALAQLISADKFAVANLNKALLPSARVVRRPLRPQPWLWMCFDIFLWASKLSLCQNLHSLPVNWCWNKEMLVFVGKRQEALSKKIGISSLLFLLLRRHHVSLTSWWEGDIRGLKVFTAMALLKLWRQNYSQCSQLRCARKALQMQQSV